MKFILGLWFAIVVFTGCEQKKPTPTPAPTTKKEVDTTRYFQVTDFIQAQLSEVRKTPYYIYKITTTKGKEDSVPVNTEELTVLAQPFLKSGIDDPALKAFYKEVIFHDQTTKSFTLNYTTQNKDLEIQNVDVLLEEDGETVKRIFIRKFIHENEGSSIQQLSWKPNNSFQISRFTEKNDNTETSQQVRVVWNEK